MSQPPASPSPPPEPPPRYYPQQQGPPQPPPGPSKTISILALVFGGAALLLSIIPIAGIFLGGLFGIAAIVLGIVGIFMSHKLFAIIGIALAVVGLIVAIIVTVALGKTAGDLIDDWPTNYEDLTNEDLTADDDTEADDPREDEVVDGTDPDSPLPAGTEVATGTWKVTFSDIVPDATEAILADEFNTPPQEGFQYFMFQVDAAYEGTESKFAWDDLFFGVYFDDTLFTEYCGYLPNDLSLAPEVYEGGTASGNACIAVPSAAAENAVISIEEYWESGERFFVAAE